MQPEISQEEIAELNVQFKKKMMSNAIYHLAGKPDTGINVRELALFQKNGLLLDQDFDEVDPTTKDILLNPDHPNRIPPLDGPIVFYKQDNDGEHNNAIVVADFFFYPVLNIRMAVLAHFEKLGEKECSLVSNLSKEAINANKENLSSDDRESWKLAALNITDALYNDFICNLAGLRQSIQADYKDGIQEHFSRVITPSSQSLSSISRTIYDPTHQVTKMEQLMKEFASNTNLQEACRCYYSDFGHLPLGPDFSLGRLVSNWVEAGNNRDTAWEEIWGWADSTPSPLSRYHACVALLQNPKLVTEESKAFLWNEILQIIYRPTKAEPDLQCMDAWQIRYMLNDYYAYYLECSNPGQSGEFYSVLAFWLAEQVSLALDSSFENHNSTLAESIMQQTTIYLRLWRMVHPLMLASPLRYSTLYLKSPWSVALQCYLADKMTELLPHKIDQEDLEKVSNTLAASIFTVFPLNKTGDNRPIYAFTNSITAAGEVWASVADESEATNMLRVVIEMRARLVDDFPLIDAVKELANSNEEVDLMLIVQRLLVAAYTENVNADELLTHITSGEWHKKALANIPIHVLELLYDALTEIQTQNKNKSSVQLPHIYALACEASIGNDDRLQQLFRLVIWNSIATSTTSAIERLLNGQNRQMFVESARQWLEEIHWMCSEAPPWVAAKLRGVAASLHI